MLQESRMLQVSSPCSKSSRRSRSLHDTPSKGLYSLTERQETPGCSRLLQELLDAPGGFEILEEALGCCRRLQGLLDAPGCSRSSKMVLGVLGCAGLQQTLGCSRRL